MKAISLSLDDTQVMQCTNCSSYAESRSSLPVLVSLHIHFHPVYLNIKEGMACFSLIYFHIVIRGNDVADTAAKSVCCSTVTAMPVPYMDLRSFIQGSAASQFWQSTWSEQCHRFFHKPSAALLAVLFL